MTNTKSLRNIKSKSNGLQYFPEELWPGVCSAFPQSLGQNGALSVATLRHALPEVPQSLLWIKVMNFGFQNQKRKLWGSLFQFCLTKTITFKESKIPYFQISSMI